MFLRECLLAQDRFDEIRAFRRFELRRRHAADAGLLSIACLLRCFFASYYVYGALRYVDCRF